MRATSALLALSLTALAACGPSPQEKQERAKAQERARLEAALKTLEERSRAPVLTDKQIRVKGEGGLEFVELSPGTGKEAATGDTVTLQFTGWCDGVKIDSSYDRGKGFSFVVGQPVVIAGWNAGIPGMKEGGTRLLIIPPELAYGHEGRTGFVGADKTLWYKIELAKVYKAQEEPIRK